MPKLNQKFISNQSMKNDFATAVVRSQASIIIPTSLFTREGLEVAGNSLNIADYSFAILCAQKQKL